MNNARLQRILRDVPDDAIMLIRKSINADDGKESPVLTALSYNGSVLTMITLDDPTPESTPEAARCLT